MAYSTGSSGLPRTSARSFATGSFGEDVAAVSPPPVRDQPARQILGIVRNRGYLGGVSFRDVGHESGEPLLDPVLFEKAQALLAERGEGYDRRFDDAHPEYLLTGLITCSRCHRCYVEAAAHGKRHRYRY